MGSLVGFIFVYILGGITFIPLVLALVLLNAHLTTPERPSESNNSKNILQRPNDDRFSLKSGTDALAEKFQRKHESDVAAGYFAVCREYVPGGVNGKPPERTTPAGEVVAAESPSVYQSMYRSIFDRKQAPTIDPNKGNGKTVRKARNVFYVVLRLGHLMLYDDVEQLEVRHVISLSYHNVSIYGGGDEIPEGELWIKRNAICLSRNQQENLETAITSLPFYLFSENCFEKEDFYFALLKNKERIPDSPESPPTPQEIDAEHLITLVQKLHSSEEHLQTRWVNAMMGRAFLALYKTPEYEAFMRKKIIKKISRVKKPDFISKIVLQKIDVGEGAPFITNPRLKDLTVNGDCCVEADVKYNGKFSVEISATARIDLGKRFGGAREVELVLAVVLNKLEGHGLVRFKPPPSNRVWVSFETAPKIGMSIVPLVGTKQFAYGPVIRAIESRIREVVAETIVLPFWDDVSFLDTSKQHFRGGIWKQDASVVIPPKTEIPEEDAEDEAEADDESVLGSVETLRGKDDRTMSLPVLPPSPGRPLKARKGAKFSHALVEKPETATSSGVEKLTRPDLPKAMRSHSFASAVDPMVSPNNVEADTTRRDSKTKDSKKDATAVMMEISNKSLTSSPADTPVGSPPNEPVLPPDGHQHGGSGSSSDSKEGAPFQGHQRQSSQASVQTSSQRSIPPTPNSTGFGSTTSLAGSETKPTGTIGSVARSLTSAEKRQSLASLGSAAAKKWGWGVLANRNEQKGKAEDGAGRPGTPEHPMGRGRPLPPPGTPLPPPEKSNAKAITMPKRKPLPPPLLPARSQEQKDVPTSRPPLPARRTRESGGTEEKAEDELLVVEAPPESEPTSPMDDRHREDVEHFELEHDDQVAAPAHTDPLKSSESYPPPEDDLPPAEGIGRTSNPPEEGRRLPSWSTAEEEESRSKSIWNNPENGHS